MIDSKQSAMVPGEHCEIEVYHGNSSLYNVLGLRQDATEKEIEEAYTKQMNMQKGLMEGFPESTLYIVIKNSLKPREDALIEAYETLRNPMRRKKYDLLMKYLLKRSQNDLAEDATASLDQLGRARYTDDGSDDDLSVATERMSINTERPLVPVVTPPQSSKKTEEEDTLIAVPLASLLEVNKTQRQYRGKGRELSSKVSCDMSNEDSQTLLDYSVDEDSFLEGESVSVFDPITVDDFQLNCEDAGYTCNDVMHSLAEIPEAFNEILTTQVDTYLAETIKPKYH